MNKKIVLTTTLLCTMYSLPALAESPLPSFDKSAVVEYPYNRTGQQDAIIEEKDNENYNHGNTGTEENPAFFVKNIKITGFDIPKEHNGKTLNSILDMYCNRNMDFNTLNELTKVITEYTRDCGYTVAQAVIPPQEVIDGQLEVRVYVASYDNVSLNSNTSEVADRVLTKFIDPLHKDEVITDKKLESVMNEINDLPGVIAKATLYPGSRPATTGVSIDVLRRPIWNNYLFYDNGGSQSSGRYRYGFHTEINNPGHQGDKIGLSGYCTNEDTDNYGINYETAIGSRGTRWGIGYSKSTYDIGWLDDFINPSGESEGISLYGLTPVYRDKTKRVTALYGYDHRKIKDNMQVKLNLGALGDFTNTDVNEKSADVYHLGIATSEYQPNRFTYADLIYWYGDIDTKNVSAYYDGNYHKLTADFNHVRYWKDWNARIELHAQMANRDLDGSERFYLGGINSVRAYPASETSGDAGYSATLEIRRATGIEGLEVATFIDTGRVRLAKSANQYESLSGWGLGLRYSKPNDWYAQFDYAWKINAQPYQSEDHDHNGRMWFQVYKMF